MALCSTYTKMLKIPLNVCSWAQTHPPMKGGFI